MSLYVSLAFLELWLSPCQKFPFSISLTLNYNTHWILLSCPSLPLSKHFSEMVLSPFPCFSLCLHCICIQLWQYLITICEWYNVNFLSLDFFCSVVCLWPSSLLFRSYLVWQSSTWIHYSLLIIVFMRFSLPKLTSAFYFLNNFVEI